MKLLCTVLMVCMVGVSTVWSDQCHLRELDLCAASGAGAKTVPVNDAEIDKYCGLAKEAKECIVSYTDKCTTPVQKEMISYVVDKEQEENANKFCTKGDNLRNSYLKHAPCLAKTQPDEKKCAVDAQAALEKLDNVPFQDKLPTACCAYTRYRKCARDIIQAACGDEAVEYAMMVVKLASSNLLDVMCQSFEASPKCASLLPPPGTPPSGNGKSLVGKLMAAYVKT